MPNLGNRTGTIEYRRRLISEILIRRPMVTRRQIQEELGEKMTNPETGEPYALGTVHNDIHAIRAGWEERATQEFGQWVAEVLAELDELSQAAWEVGDFELVLKINDRKRKLLGLDKPTRSDITSGDAPLQGQVMLVLPDNGRGDNLYADSTATETVALSQESG